MIRVEERCWPLVIAVAVGMQSLAGQQGFLATWNRWLDRDTPFAVLRIFVDAEALVHPEGGARLAKQWMEDNRGRIRHSVMGLASVVPAVAYEKMSRMDVEKAFGVPGGVFPDPDSALGWIDGQVFGPRGLTFDRTGAGAVASRLIEATA